MKKSLLRSKMVVVVGVVMMIAMVLTFSVKSVTSGDSLDTAYAEPSNNFSLESISESASELGSVYLQNVESKYLNILHDLGKDLLNSLKSSKIWLRIAFLVHDYQFDSFVWTGYTAKAKYVCSRNKRHVIYFDADVTEEITTEPSCESDGVITYTASYKNHSDTKTENINALGHSWGEWEETKDATDVEEGEEQRVCSRCGEIETQSIPVVGHEHTIVAVEAKEATCTEAGNIAHFKCTICERMFDDIDGDTRLNIEDVVISELGHDLEYHEGKDATCTEIGWAPYETCSRCEHTTYQEIPALGHDIIHRDAKEATCTEIGWNAYEFCSCCDYTTYEAIPPLGHDYQAVVTAPTCTEAGYTTHTCTRCRTSYADTYVSANGHSFGEWTVTKDVTCTENGQRERVCSVCQYKETEEIIARHDYKAVVTEPTCTEAGYTTYTCSICNSSYTAGYVSALGHDYQYVVVAPTCEEEGYTTYTCTRCGDSYNDLYVDALGHEFGDWTVTKEAQVGVKGEETRTCSVCQAEEKRSTPSLPYIPVVNEEGKRVYSEIVTEEAKDVTDLFAQAKKEEGTVEIKTTTEDNKELVIVFDSSAVNTIGDANVSLSAKVITENLTVENAEMILEVTLAGAKFENGEATVSIPFVKEVPDGKVAKVYYIADDGTKTDMNATLVDGNLVFTTNHFSTYAVVLEDELFANDFDIGWISFIFAMIVLLYFAVAIVLIKVYNKDKKILCYGGLAASAAITIAAIVIIAVLPSVISALSFGLCAIDALLFIIYGTEEEKKADEQE